MVTAASASTRSGCARGSRSRRRCWPIRRLRGLLGELAERGKTVLVSSHLLSEAERLVDDVVIVERGRLVAAGPLDEVAGLDGGLEQRFLELTGGGV
jgi:ABC-type multidrug transport system ATPase subunit